MIPLAFGSLRRPLRILCLGAHSDDIEIGCGGTVLEWLSAYRAVDVTWAVMSAAGSRASEARSSAARLLARARVRNIVIHEIDDGYFPARFSDVKQALEDLRVAVPNPDVILTHRIEDRHQDHRTVAEVVWQTWRNHLIFEFEIHKYEGDLAHPNVYVSISRRNAKRKVEHLLRHFGTQRSKAWFHGEAFHGLMYLRGIECRAESGSAEAFYVRKALLGL